MALTACWECNKQISDTAATCPHCGAAHRAAPVAVVAPVARRPLWPWLVGVPVGAFLLFLAYGFSIPEYEAAARERREVCEKIAAPYQRSECDRIYHSDVAAGRAAAQQGK